MATRVEFHTGVADDVGFACRLLRKAYGQGVRVLVRAPRERLGRLDRELWTFVEREFLPHLRFAMPGALPAQAARTPIWLVDGEVPEGLPGLPGAPAVLVNLGAAVVPDLAAFERVIEIVGDEPDDQAGGRERWRAYKAAGLAPEHHGGR